MIDHSHLLRRYQEGSVQCLVEPALARQYYCDLSAQHREEICGDPEVATAVRIKGMIGFDTVMFLVVAIISIIAFGYWSIAVIPLTWLYWTVLRGDASMGFRTFRWPIALCAFWWAIGIFLPFGGIAGTMYFISLPLIYVLSLLGYRQASRAVMALAFRNKKAFLYLTDGSRGRPVVIVNESPNQNVEPGEVVNSE